MTVDHDTAKTPSITAERWLEDHGDALYAYALAALRDSHVAEELVQETLLAGLASVDDFLGRSAQRTWLVGILKHKVVDHLRRVLRERPLSELGADGLDDLFDRQGHWKVSPARWGVNPRELAENAEFHDVLAQCLSRLPSRMAHLFWLREAEEVETRELCDRLNVSATNMGAILHRARCGLRKCLTLHWFDGGRR